MNNQPKFGAEAFQCPHCQTVAQQKWFSNSSSSDVIFSIILQRFMEYRTQIEDYPQKVIQQFINDLKIQLSNSLRRFIPSEFSISTCRLCGKISLWMNNKMVYPKTVNAPNPNIDLTEEIKEIFLEAASIVDASPKGAVALLRLALQKLLQQVGKPGKNINDDIKELVSEGLNPKIQQALDLVRVVGNNAVHPGHICFDDNGAIAIKLFSLINLIAEELITRPKEIDRLYEDTLPKETKEHIKKRDGQI